MATNEREDIIRRAVLDKLGNSLNFFTADEILTVAGITPAQIKEIEETITAKTKPIAAKATNRKAPKKRAKGQG